MKPKASSIASYLGIAAAVLVPALVVAQQQRFAAGNVLTASSLNSLVDRIAALEAQLQTQQQGGGVSKGQLYFTPPVANTLDPGEVGNVRATCNESAADIMLSCSCGGQTPGSNSGNSNLDTRSSVVQNPAGAPSTCECSGENLSDVAVNIFALGWCLRGQ